MGKRIAACGNDCAACPRYTMHPYEKTGEELRHTAELWLKIGYRDHLVTNDEISCTGCKPDNPLEQAKACIDNAYMIQCVRNRDKAIGASNVISNGYTLYVNGVALTGTN